MKLHINLCKNESSRERTPLYTFVDIPLHTFIFYFIFSCTFTLQFVILLFNIYSPFDFILFLSISYQCLLFSAFIRPLFVLLSIHPLFFILFSREHSFPNSLLYFLISIHPSILFYTISMSYQCLLSPVFIRPLFVLPSFRIDSPFISDFIFSWTFIPQFFIWLFNFDPTFTLHFTFLPTVD